MIQLVWALSAYLASAGTHATEVTADQVKEKLLSMTNEESLFVKFYAPWCGHCKAMAEDYEMVAEQIKADGLADKRHVWECDLTKDENADAKEWFYINGYPTMLSFYQNKQLSYRGGRYKEAMVDYIVNQTYMEHLPTAIDISPETFVITTTSSTTTRSTTPPNVEVLNEIIQLDDDSFEAMTQVSSNTSDAWIVNFYTPWCSLSRAFQPEYQLFANIMKDYPSLKIAQVNVDKAGDKSGLKDSCLRNRFNIEGYPTTLLFKDGMAYEFNWQRKAASIKRWIERGDDKSASPPTGYHVAKNTFKIPPPGNYKTQIDVDSGSEALATASVFEQTKDILTDIAMIYRSMFDPEIFKVMKHNQPVIFAMSAVLVGLCALVISYQMFCVVLGVAFGKKRVDKED